MRCVSAALRDCTVSASSRCISRPFCLKTITVLAMSPISSRRSEPSTGVSNSAAASLAMAARSRTSGPVIVLTDISSARPMPATIPRALSSSTSCVEEFTRADMVSAVSFSSLTSALVKLMIAVLIEFACVSALSMTARAFSFWSSEPRSTAVSSAALTSLTPLISSAISAFFAGTFSAANSSRFTALI
jgi:hypothetical protein